MPNGKLQITNRDAARKLSKLLYAPGHGATESHLAFSLIYYVLACGPPARVCVCLGSGGGFVPALMRQAQRDLGLQSARTYLVDAILPEAGAGTPEGLGWFGTGSFLRAEFPEIICLNCLTPEACQYFRKNGIAIDFLHIDADHSYDAVLADFNLYRDLLSPGAFVTLHDLSLGSVKNAVRKIEINAPEYAALELPDIGNGLAILRRKEQRLSSPMPPAEADLPSTPARASDPNSEIWHYLLDPVLQTRYALAAHFLRDAGAILEIGGYKTPITDFLTHTPKKLVVIDPYLEPRRESMLRGQPCDVRHLAVDLDELDDTEFSGEPFALVFLGMDLYSPEKSMAQTVDTHARFVELLSRAERAVLEYPQHWERSKRLFEILLSLLRPRIVYECVMDLSQNPVEGLDPDMKAERLVRRLVVVDRMEAVVDRGAMRANLARALYGSGAAAVLAAGAESFDAVPGALSLDDAQIAYDEASFEKGEEGELLVRTSNKPWSYAVFVPFQTPRPENHAALMHVRARIQKGTLAVGALSNDGSEVIGERFLVENVSGVQELDVFVPDLSAAKGFLVRNGQVAGESEGTLLEIRLSTRSLT